MTVPAAPPVADAGSDHDRDEHQGRAPRSALRESRSVVAVTVVVAFVLVVFVAWPTLRMVLEPTGEQWRGLLSSPRLHRTTLNTLTIGVLSTVTATVLGFAFAYGLSRPDFPCRRLFRWMAILPLVSPPFVVGLSLMLLFGRRGLITHQVLGLDLDLFGLPALWIVQTIAFFPIAVLAITPILKQQGGRFEWAARDLGEGWFSTFRRVTLPLAWPGVVSALLLVAMFVLADFGNPVLVGSGFRVLSVEAYTQAVGRFDLGAAAVVSAVLFAPALVLFVVQRRVSRRRSFTSIGGRGGDVDPPPLPPVVRIVLVTVMSLVSLSLVVTYVAILVGAFVQAWGADWTLTLRHWEFAVLRGDDLWNSFRFAAIAAFATAVFGVVSAWVIHRGRMRGLGVLDGLAIFPAAIPGTMVGISWIIVFNEPPLLLTGTGLILIMVMMLRTLPVGYRTAVGSLQQISPSLEEAASDLGAGRLETLARVTAPMLTSAAVTAFIFSFLNSINTLSAVIFLVSPGRQLASPTIVGMAEFGRWGEATALAAALMTVAFLGLAAFRWLGGRGRRDLFDL